MRRRLKIADAIQPCLPGLEDRDEQTESSYVHLESKEADDKGEGAILERILARGNMVAAFNRVLSNKGAPGIDGMTVDEMGVYIGLHWQEISESIRNGTYEPKPVRRVEIPKPDGGVRLLGVPTVIDRVIQQACAQVLTEIFEPLFSESSFGFRPGRKASDALNQARDYYRQGYIYSVDLDLSKYFDTVNHDILLGMLRKCVPDESVIRMIRKFLKSGVMKDGLISPTHEGTPQGGPLSPLLSNIYLTAFDRLLESRGHKFVRYADDCNIYVKSIRSAQRVLLSCTRFLEGRLKLKVNQEKSKTGSPLELKFLGFKLYKTKLGDVTFLVHEKTLKRFKSKVREITSRKTPKSIQTVLSELSRYTTGWLGYYRLASLGSILRDMAGWIRRRIRQLHWKQWKTISCRYANLKRLGAPAEKLWGWVFTRKGYWRIAGSQILTHTLTNAVLERLGLDDIEKRYKRLCSES